MNFGIELFDIAIPDGIHGGTIAMLLSIVPFVGISLLSERPQLDPGKKAVMDV